MFSDTAQRAILERYLFNSLGSIAHICAHLFRTFRVHSAYMRAFEIIHANCHGCLPSFVEQGTQLDQNYISCHLRYVWVFPHNTTTNTSGWLDLPFTIPGKWEAGSACAVKTINCCHEYPKKRGCAVMAFTAEEVISMLNDTYEDNSDDD